MRGELDFEAALDARVALLKGLDERVIDHCHDAARPPHAGAEALVRTMAANGAYCLLVSGGFSRFADRVAAEIGFDAACRQRIAGRGRPAGGHGRAGRSSAPRASARPCSTPPHARQIPLDAALAVGDGANDIPMLKAAGLGIAYHAKPAAAAAADARIEANDLTALLYAQGYARKDWAD